MKVTILTPYYYPSVRGNSITVQRIESGLRDQGVAVAVFSLEHHADPDRLRALVLGSRPDVIHGFHAYLTGGLACDAAEALGVPAALTLTGTDVNHDLFDPERGAAVRHALLRARGIVVFHETMGEKVRREIPGVGARIRVIGQAVHCDETRYDLRGKLGLRPEDFVFFVPAGIRRVKNVTFCIEPLARLRARHPQVKLVFAGPVIEAPEGEALQAALRGRDWAFYLGALTHEEVCACLYAVDAVVNSSISEGGMSNAILEAMSKGVVVLASDIEGNRSVIRDGGCGFLYTSEADFLAKAERVVTDPDLRRRMGAEAKARIERDFPMEGEIGEYLRFYQHLLADGPAP